MFPCELAALGRNPKSISKRSEQKIIFDFVRRNIIRRIVHIVPFEYLPVVQAPNSQVESTKFNWKINWLIEVFIQFAVKCEHSIY